jgi:hypothetical protein
LDPPIFGRATASGAKLGRFPRLDGLLRQHVRYRNRSAAGGIIEMAASTCAKCGGHSFERAFLTPVGEDRRLAIIQCASCGTPIGILDSPSSVLIESLQKQVAAIDAGLVRIAKALSQ